MPKPTQFNPYFPPNSMMTNMPNIPNMQNGPFIPPYQNYQPMMNVPFNQGPMIRPNPNLKN